MPQGKYPRRQWPEEVIRFIVDNASENVKISAMAAAVNREFGTSYTLDQIKGQYVRRKLPFANGHRHNIIMTDEQAEYLASIIPGRPSAECAVMLNEKYDTSITPSQIRGWKKNHKTPSGYDARYRAGEKSWITGKKFPGRTNSGCFKAGHISANASPIGAERISEGYVLVKTGNGNRNRNWRPKHHLVWEEHNGPVPEGCRVVFLDGDRRNFDISNLALVTEQEMVYAAIHIGLTEDPEINRSVLAMAKLQATVRNREREE